MHLRDGKVLAAPPGNSRTMAEPKKASEPKAVDIVVPAICGLRFVACLRIWSTDPWPLLPC